ncbi:MAG: LysR family substrate-binding domain-containing protein, partial [Verrucomicrobiota bacterium]
EERTPERVWEMVAKGRLDIALTRPVHAHASLGMQTLRLRNERLCAALPYNHRWVGKKSLSWSTLADQPLIILARREGAGLHDEILAACRTAGFTPKLSHTPSLIGTVLRYVESGAGIGIVPECLGESEASPRWSPVRLTPAQTVPLVMVWKEERQEPPALAFRNLMAEWLREGKLWQPPQ